MKQEKKELRMQMKKMIAQKVQSDLERKILSMNTTANFVTSDVYKKAECLFLFISTKSEIETNFLIEKAFLDYKNVVVPRTNGDTMDFYLLNPLEPIQNQLELGAFGISEPKTTLQKVSVEKIPTNSVFILPGYAFSKSGERLGHGKGFYDRYIALVYANKNPIHLPNALVGFCYDFQLIEKVPTNEFDINVTHVVTEKQFLTVP